jgi:hypothetical protein
VDAALINTSTPSFVWSSTAGVSGTYTLEYALDEGFTASVQTIAGITDTVNTPPEALADATYYWHVQAFNSIGDSSDYQTTPFSFTVDTQVPDVPTLMLPVDLAVVDDNTPTFEWSGTAGSGGTYTLEFASDSDFTFVVTVGDIEDTVYEELTPLMDGDYYWHVQATDQAGHVSGYQTTPFRFSVDLGVPPVPILVSPPDSSFTCDTTPVFTWIGSNPLLEGGLRTDAGSRGSGAAFSPVTYTLQYSADPLFAQATTVVGIADATYPVPDSAPMPYGTCYWRVEAVDGADNHSGYQADAFRFGVFVAGDQNQDGLTTSADVIYLVNFVFKGGATPQPCEAAGDSNCDGSVTSSDIIYQVNYVFKGGPPPCNVGALIAGGTWSCP